MERNLNEKMSAFKKIALGHRLKAIAGAFLVHFRGDTEAQFTTIYRYGTWCIRGTRIPRLFLFKSPRRLSENSDRSEGKAD